MKGHGQWVLDLNPPNDKLNVLLHARDIYFVPILIIQINVNRFCDWIQVLGTVWVGLKRGATSLLVVIR